MSPYPSGFGGTEFALNMLAVKGQKSVIAEKKKPVVIEESKTRYTRRLKFFDENKNFSFIIMDEDNSDIFVHYDDLLKANISKEALKMAKVGFLRLSFSCMSYIGKYNKSRKAVEVQILPDQQ